MAGVSTYLNFPAIRKKHFLITNLFSAVNITVTLHASAIFRPPTECPRCLKTTATLLCTLNCPY